MKSHKPQMPKSFNLRGPNRGGSIRSSPQISRKWRMLRIAGFFCFSFNEMFNLVASSLSLFLSLFITTHLPWENMKNISYIANFPQLQLSSFRALASNLKGWRWRWHPVPSMNAHLLQSFCPVTNTPNHVLKNIFQHSNISISISIWYIYMSSCRYHHHTLMTKLCGHRMPRIPRGQRI